MPSFKKRPLSSYDGSSIGDIVASIEKDQSYGIRYYTSCARLSEKLLLYRYSAAREGLPLALMTLRFLAEDSQDRCFYLARLEIEIKDELRKTWLVE